MFAPAGLASVEFVEELEGFGFGRHDLARRRSFFAAKPKRYDPVLKFVPSLPGGYEMMRMTYRGAGGWSYPLASGSLDSLVARHLAAIGTDAFFDIF